MLQFNFCFVTVPVVKETWGKEAELIEYFSEIKDDSIPTIDLGVYNTERGECSYSMTLHLKKEFAVFRSYH